MRRSRTATEQFDVRQATFTPQRTDTLRPEMVAKIGQAATFEAQNIIEEGPYEGQWAWLSHDSDWYWWIPECDLAFAP